MKTTFNSRFFVLLSLIIVAATTRFFTVTGHTPLINFTPIGAIAMFAGVYFKPKWKAILIPLLVLLVSDLVINLGIYKAQYGVMYKGWQVVYGVFIIIVFLGERLLQKISIQNIFLTACIASFSHWIITDFAVWIGGIDITTGLPFTKDIYGLFKCYALAFPYLQSFFAGTIVYSAGMFIAFEFAKKRFPVLAVE